MTWPMATGTVWFEFPKAERLSVDLQRTHYLEEIICGNDFQASVLAIRFSDPPLHAPRGANSPLALQ